MIREQKQSIRTFYLAKVGLGRSSQRQRHDRQPSEPRLRTDGKCKVGKRKTKACKRQLVRRLSAAYLRTGVQRAVVFQSNP